MKQELVEFVMDGDNLVESDNPVIDAQNDPEPEQDEFQEEEAVQEDIIQPEPDIIDDEEEVKAQPKKKGNHNPVKGRINTYSRKYHEEARRAQKAEEELKRLRDENDKLKRSSDMSSKAFLETHDNLIQANIKHATQLKMQARMDGDVNGEIEADKMLAAHMADKRYLDTQKHNQKYYEEEQKYEEERRRQYEQQHAMQQQQQPQQPTLPPEAYDWLEENQWFNMDNPDEYNPYLREKAGNYSDYLERKYAQEGRGNQIYSQEFFNDLDKYMSKHINQVRPQGNVTQNVTQGELVMNRPKAPVASAGRTSQHPQQGQRHYFSKREVDMMKAHNWTPKQWLENKKRGQQMLREGQINVMGPNGYPAR